MQLLNVVDAAIPAITQLSAPSGDAAVLAQTEVNTTGLKSWIQDNIYFVVLLLAACAVGFGGAKGNFSKVVTVGGLSLVGVAFFAVATNEGAAAGIGNWMLGLFGIDAAAPAAQ